MPAGVERQDLVVEPGEAALVFGDEPRLKRALAIARHVDRQRALVGQDRLPARPIAMIGRVVGLGPAGRIAQMMRELAAQGALDDGLLEAADGGLELLVGDRPLAERTGRESRREPAPAARQALAFAFAGHEHSSCYAPHTKFLTPSGTQHPPPCTQHSTRHHAPRTRHPVPGTAPRTRHHALGTLFSVHLRFIILASSRQRASDRSAFPCTLRKNITAG